MEKIALFNTKTELGPLVLEFFERSGDIELLPSGQAFMAALALRHGAPLALVIAEGTKVQETLFEDVQTWCQHLSTSAIRLRPLYFPSWDILPDENKLPHADVISERLETVIRLLKTPVHEKYVIVTQAMALIQKTFSPDQIRGKIRTIQKGDTLEMEDLLSWLETQGYEPEAEVTHKGEFARRGGVLDVYPPISPWPVRLEFFGSEIDSIRYFDPITQLSKDAVELVELSPAGELGLLRRVMDSADFAVQSGTLLDFLPPKSVSFLAEQGAVASHLNTYLKAGTVEHPLLEKWEVLLERLETAVECLNPHDAETGEIRIPTAEELAGEPGGRVRFETMEIYRPIGNKPPEPQIAQAQRKEFFVQLQRWLRQNYEVHVFCPGEGERTRFAELWREYFPPDQPSAVSKSKSVSSKAAQPQVYSGNLSRGFVVEPHRLVIVSDAEIFGRSRLHRPRKLKRPHAQAMRSALDINFAELEPGDFVVHLLHGIAKFVGLQALPVGSGKKGAHDGQKERTQECLALEFAAGDSSQPAPRLYVPITEAHLVGKYVGAGKARPQLNTLGGTRWAKARAHAEKSVVDLAGQYLKIQAAREAKQGYSFSSDTPWQREFEGSFGFEETPDQLKAISETKKDMESDRPMDRLICGDVGFGKTEVAIRAAFKAVMSGKQVALLVPTTVLAQQHFNNFRERMAEYPIRVELLSRFKTRKEQTATVQNLATGQVDIVIGTHRLVQKDIQFKDLGLVIIDEEQRFGVMHKERFKMLRELVDVLTLSATPIPRTLYLALTGARDMSTIETPPQDRLPVETIVAQYDERLIRDAIQREINRDGQVFYLHNRVMDIENVASRLRTLVPSARLLVGHGQMNPDQLEEVMTRFINGEADVLLSTTIIESGIDIPNANTIIIDRADRFGLSDLYQLRGRVGRYKHQAFAYLLLPRHAGLLSEARKRISAIKQYSSLGSGFKIAMRDLEIRGAGNLLGAEQSGHITAVGFELYCQLLKQSVAILKGEKVPTRIEVLMRLDFLALDPGEEVFARVEAKTIRSVRLEISVPRESAVYTSHPVSDKPEASQPESREPAYLPLDYVQESQHRIEAYKKLASVNDSEGLGRFRSELRDRFGPLPPAVHLLLGMAEVKLLAASKNITVVETKGPKVMLTRNHDFLMVRGKFPRLEKKNAKGKLQELKQFLASLAGASPHEDTEGVS